MELFAANLKHAKVITADMKGIRNGEAHSNPRQP
jgi:hypothetical protein